MRLAVERIYPTVSHNRYDLQVEPFGGCMPLYGLRNAKSYTCNPPQFDLKKLFQKN